MLIQKHSASQFYCSLKQTLYIIGLRFIPKQFVTITISYQKSSAFQLPSQNILNQLGRKGAVMEHAVYSFRYSCLRRSEGDLIGRSRKLSFVNYLECLQRITKEMSLRAYQGIAFKTKVTTKHLYARSLAQLTDNILSKAMQKSFTRVK